MISQQSRFKKAYHPSFFEPGGISGLKSDMEETVGVPGVLGCWYDGVGGPPAGPPEGSPTDRGPDVLGPEDGGPPTPPAAPPPEVTDFGPVVVAELGPEPVLIDGPSSGGKGPAEGFG